MPQTEYKPNGQDSMVCFIPGYFREKTMSDISKSLFGIFSFIVCFTILLTSTSHAAGRSEVHHLKTNGNIVHMKVTQFKSETVRVDRPFKEVLIGSSDIADVVPLTDRSIYVLGKKIGMTRMSVLDANKNVMGIVDIEVTYDLEALRLRLAKELPGQNIEVSSVNGKVLLTGHVRDAVAIKKAMTFAEQIAPKAVTNGLAITSPQQVMLEVRFVEAKRNSGRDLGVGLGVQKGSKFFGITQADSVSGGGVDGDGNQIPLLRNILGGLASSSVPFGSAVANVLNSGLKVDVFIQALEERGLARRLAEPNLITLSGQNASFLAGGEFPFPVDSGDDKITVEFKKFGIGLNFTPTVLANGLINLKILPEVSELDLSNTVRVGSAEIPSLVVRRAETTIELRDGQSFAVAGLLQSNHSKAQRQLPWIGSVPVLGTLFRSAAYQKDETDLVIIVTPRLVKPKAPGERLITPLDRRVASNDGEFFLNGIQEVPAKRPNPSQGHILELENGPKIGGGAKGAYDDYKFK